MAGEKRAAPHQQRFKVDFKLSQLWASTAGMSACVSTLLSLLTIIQTMTLGLRFTFSIEFNIAIAGYHIGWAMNQMLCEKWHSAKYFYDMNDRALRQVIMQYDADRIANGMKPFTDMTADD